MSDAIQEILPGSWIGVFGGGQLGRMLTHAAQRMGYHVAVYEPEEACPAGQAADVHVGHESERQPEEVVSELSQNCSVMTLEFENISPELARLASKNTLTHPSADFLEMCQDRIREKSSLSVKGFPTTPFLALRTIGQARAAVESLGLPLVLKTSTSGYDGKGQAVVRVVEDLESAWSELDADQVIAEERIDFEAEVSMLVARNQQGQVESFPLLENDHSNHILDVTRCPVDPRLQAFEGRAREICHGIAEAFQVIGIFSVEFFVTKSGELLINEIAPRPHNSGHLTIEAFTCSQFEQQVRAICNLPLQPAEQLRPAAMVNLLGDLWIGGEPAWSQMLRRPNAYLHLYGKAQPRAGRKMGHITVLDAVSAETAVTCARQIRDSIAINCEVEVAQTK